MRNILGRLLNNIQKYITNYKITVLLHFRKSEKITAGSKVLYI